MKIQERITFTFEEIFTLIAKDPQITQLDKFVFTGVHNQRSENPFTLIGKMEVSWDDIHQTINTELEKIGKSYTDFTVQIDYNNFLCCGKETSTTNEQDGSATSDIFLNTSLKELISDEGEIKKMNTSVRLYNALKASCTGENETLTLKEFLCIPHKPRNFGKKSMLELVELLSEKGIIIQKFRAKDWFSDMF